MKTEIRLERDKFNEAVDLVVQAILPLEGTLDDNYIYAALKHLVFQIEKDALIFPKIKIKNLETENETKH